MSDIFKEALRALSSEPQKERTTLSDFSEGSRSIIEAVNKDYLKGVGFVSESDVISLVWMTEDVHGSRSFHSIVVKYETYNAKNRGPAYELFFGNVQVGSGSLTKKGWRTELEDLIIESISLQTPTGIYLDSGPAKL